MEKNTCSVCLKPKATLDCGLCAEHLCKNCAQFQDEDTFSFLKSLPSDLSHTVYCTPCYDSKVAAAVENYASTMERAKDVMVFFKAQNKETRLVKRLEDPIEIKECGDRDEVILRLAFIAAQKDYNSIVDVDVQYKKIKDGNYQTHKWSGSAIPAHVIEKKLIRDRSFNPQSN